MNRTFEVVGVLVLVVGVALFFTIGNTEVSQKEKDYEKVYQECIGGQTILFHAEAIRTGKKSLCAKSYNPEFCEARIEKNDKFCTYEITLFQEYCKGTMLRDVNNCGNSTVCKAEVTQNPELCKNLEREELEEYGEDMCEILAGKQVLYEQQCTEKTWFTIATLNKNSELCNNILNETMKSTCISESS